MMENVINRVERAKIAVKRMEFIEEFLYCNRDNITVQRVLSNYDCYLQGFCEGKDIMYTELEKQLDRSMLSIHFTKQFLNFNTKQELYNYIKKNKGAFQDTIINNLINN